MMSKKLCMLVLALSLLMSIALPASAEIRIDLRGEAYFRFGEGLIQRSVNNVWTADWASNFELSGVELDPRFTLSNESGDLLILAFQIYVNGSMMGAMKEMHYGNGYLIIPTGLGKPTFKLGQQVIPFGQLAEYDTHSQIIQNLYAKSLGLRIDSGASIYGMLGKYDYWLMIGNGAGPNKMEYDLDKVITGRIAKTYQLGNSDLRLGLSALYGNLPYYELGKDAYQAMVGVPTKFETKTRYALDAELSAGPILVRSELIKGTNKPTTGMSTIEDDAIGYYIELRYVLFSGVEVIGKYDYWQPYISENKNTTTTTLGLNYTINKNLEFQFAAERFNNNNISGIPAQHDRFTLQLGTFF